MSPIGCTATLGVITVVATSIAAGSTRFSARGGVGPEGYLEATLAPHPIATRPAGGDSARVVGGDVASAAMIGEFDRKFHWKLFVNSGDSERVNRQRHSCSLQALLGMAQ